MKEKMTFADLVNKIAEETGSSKQLIQNLLHETVKLTREELSKGGHVNIPDLGQFHLKWQNSRMGRNPQTGEAIEIPAHSKIVYKATASLRKFINRKYAHLRIKLLNENKKLAKETSIVDSAIKEKVISLPPIETSNTSTGKKKKRPFLWLWILIPLLIIILACFYWCFNEKSETEKVQPTIEKVEDKEVVPNAETDESPVVGNKTIPAEPVIKESTGISGGEFTIKPGDNLWTLAKQYYGKAELWPNIYRANLTKIENPDNLAVGLIVYMPPLEGKPERLTSADSANISEAYIYAYDVYKNLDKADANNYLWVANQYDIANILAQFDSKINDEDLMKVKNRKPK